MQTNIPFISTFPSLKQVHIHIKFQQSDKYDVIREILAQTSLDDRTDFDDLLSTLHTEEDIQQLFEKTCWTHPGYSFCVIQLSLLISHNCVVCKKDKQK
jgi:hypothetical protein